MIDSDKLMKNKYVNFRIKNFVSLELSTENDFTEHHRNRI